MFDLYKVPNMNGLSQDYFSLYTHKSLPLKNNRNEKMHFQKDVMQAIGTELNGLKASEAVSFTTQYYSPESMVRAGLFLPTFRAGRFLLCG